MHPNFYCLKAGVCESRDTSVNTRLKIIFSRTSRRDLGLLNASGSDQLLTGNPFIFHLIEAEDLETMPLHHLGLLILGPVWSAPVWSIQVFLLLLKDPSHRSGSVQLKGFDERCRRPSISSVVLQHLIQPETTY